MSLNSGRRDTTSIGGIRAVRISILPISQTSVSRVHRCLSFRLRYARPYRVPGEVTHLQRRCDHLTKITTVGCLTGTAFTARLIGTMPPPCGTCTMTSAHPPITPGSVLVESTPSPDTAGSRAIGSDGPNAPVASNGVVTPKPLTTIITCEPGAAGFVQLFSVPSALIACAAGAG